MKNYVFISLIIFCNSQSVFCQQDKKLIDFLVEAGEAESHKDIRALHKEELLKKENSEIGIYKFFLLGSHHTIYFFLKDGESITIINKEILEEIIVEVSEFLQKHNFSFEDKISYYREILKILEQDVNNSKGRTIDQSEMIKN